MGLTPEKLHDARNLTAEQNRKAESRAQPGFHRERHAWKISIDSQLANPIGLAAGPDTSGQANAAGKRAVAACIFELRCVQRRSLPTCQPLEQVGLAFDAPQLAHLPAQAFGNCLQKDRRCRGQ